MDTLYDSEYASVFAGNRDVQVYQQCTRLIAPRSNHCQKRRRCECWNASFKNQREKEVE